MSKYNIYLFCFSVCTMSESSATRAVQRVFKYPHSKNLITLGPKRCHNKDPANIQSDLKALAQTS